MKRAKFIFVTGGVMSSLGKGISASSIGLLLECCGLRVTLQKLDPYINVDPGTMNPFEHGEVFVTDDGAETDLDLGHYERFTGARLSKKNNLTSGKVYHSVISKEREGKFLGKTVQVIPHITDEIKSRVLALEDDNDVIIVEIGGTVGDIESLPFLEAVRQLRSDIGRQNTLFLHLTYVPYVSAAGELKTKPTQHSVKELLQIGIQPDILLCRTEDKFLPDEVKRKIALFCNIERKAVITAKDVEHIYEVPLIYKEEGLAEIIVEYLDMWTKKPDMEEWESLVRRIKSPAKSVRIAVVGKYVSHGDSYKSLHEALYHGGVANDSRVEIKYVDSEETEGSGADHFSDVHAVLVPGGFGERGVEGKIGAARYARENGVPFFGICYGMQLAVVEFSRNVCAIADADTRENSEDTPNPVIDIMESQKHVDEKGGTMRLGAYPCVLRPGTLAERVYGAREISERHRHRFEVNNRYRDALEEKGMALCGLSPDGSLVEIMELSDHPWFIGCQFHPEFKSKPLAVHPLFGDFIRAALEYKDSLD